MAYTNPVGNISSFMMQRKRWASKSKHYTDNDMVFVAVTVLFCSLSIIASLCLSFYKIEFLYLSFLLFCMKSIPDYLLLHSFSSFFGKQKLLKYFVATQLVYPFFTAFMAIYGSFGQFEWKKRIYK